MGFLATTAKHRTLQWFIQIAAGLFILYDARNGTILKSAFGDIGMVGCILWSGGIWLLLGLISISVMLGPFYAAGGRVWTEGGREQYAHAGGYTASFYGTLVIEVLVILLYPFLRERGVLLLSSGFTIALLCAVLSALVCRVLANMIFRRF